MRTIDPRDSGEDVDVTEVLAVDRGGSGLGADDALATGSLLGDYIIEHVIGRGGGGVVYSARHRLQPRRAAIKALRRDMTCFPNMIARFVREAEAVNQIRHPNIVEVYEIGELAPGQPYYAMELLEGEDLRKLMQVRGRFSAREALEILEPVCAALAAAHAHGIIHRDVKASNVLLTPTDGATNVKLLDFGIAKMLNGEQLGQGLTEPGAILGTAHAMAPEQIRGERLDGRVDVYALGVLLYQMLTGQYPFVASEPAQVAFLHLQAPAPRPSAVVHASPALDAVVLRCLEKRPERRFATVIEFIEALRAAVDTAPSGGTQWSSEAVAVSLRLETSASLHEDAFDDALVDDLSAVLDQTEQELVRLGFVLPVQTSNALLAVQAVPRDAATLRAAAERSMRSLVDRLGVRSTRHPAVRLSIGVSSGAVLCRRGSGGEEIVGGPLLDTSSWVHASTYESAREAREP